MRWNKKCLHLSLTLTCRFVNFAKVSFQTDILVCITEQYKQTRNVSIFIDVMENKIYFQKSLGFSTKFSLKHHSLSRDIIGEDY